MNDKHNDDYLEEDLNDEFKEDLAKLTKKIIEESELNEMFKKMACADFSEGILISQDLFNILSDEGVEEETLNLVGITVEANDER